MGYLSSQVEAAVGDEALILAGNSAAKLGSLFGGRARVQGCVVVHPQSFRPALSGSVATLTVPSPTEDYSDVVARFSATLSNEPRLGPFVERIDPGRIGIVASANGVPAEPFAGRRRWAPDGAECHRLEAKTPEGAFLDEVLPWAPSIPPPRLADRSWLSGVCADYGCSGVVAQRTGPSSGGTGTYLCPSFERAAAALDVLGEQVRLTPLLEGVAHNVMGFVSPLGEAMALPVSRQLTFVDAQHRPIYAGNVTGEDVDPTERSAIASEVRAAARRLHRAGFAGPFGLDFIRHAGGSRTYHDLNARVNGVINSLDMCAGPVSETLMTAPGWAPGRLAHAEEEIASEVMLHPMARWRLTGNFGPDDLPPIPASGTYRLEPEEGVAEWLGPSCSPREVCGDAAVLRSGLFPGFPLRPAQRVSLGDLFVSLDLSKQVQSMWGGKALSHLIRIVLGAARQVA